MSVALAHDAAGPADGPAVLLLHSIGTDREVWRPVAGQLAAAGLRTIVVDLRGHGATAAPPGPYGLEDLGGDVLALLDVLGLRSASVAGVSLGGMVAAWLGAHAPERTERLVLCCTASWLGGPAMWGPRADQARAEGTASLADASLGRWLTPAFAAARPDVVAALRATISRTESEGYAGCAAAIGAMDLRPDLAAIAASTLVVAGADDPATTVDEHLRPLADAIPGARLLTVEGASHLAPLERPDVVGPAIAAHLTEQETPPMTTDRPDADAEQAPTHDGRPAHAYDETGLRTRREVLGDAHVDRSLRNATEFSRPFQEFITRYAWGDVWTREGLDRRTRSIVTLTALTALGAEGEIPMHVRAALHHGLTPAEISEVLLHAAVYTGLPRANAAFALAQEVLREEGLLDADGPA